MFKNIDLDNLNQISSIDIDIEIAEAIEEIF